VVAARLRGVIFASVTVLALMSSCAAMAEPLPVTVVTASAENDARSGRPILTIRLADESRKALAAFSQTHVGYPVEMRIDGKSMIKAVLREPILGGVFQVNTDSIEEARRLADKLSHGPARVEFEAASQ
jgi:preprotein translocase subunit SecD